MSDWPSVEADYADIRAKAMCDLVRDPRAVVYRADAVIAGLEAEVEALRLGNVWPYQQAIDRAEAAEAEVERLARGVRCSDCCYWSDDRIGADWGTCSHKGQHPFMPPVNRHDPCTMAPSRWTAREEGGDE